MSELKRCPFCGGEAQIQVTEEQFLIVGCSNRDNPSSSMLCPNPSIVIYKDDIGEWNFKWWNRRANTRAEDQKTCDTCRWWYSKEPWTTCQNESVKEVTACGPKFGCRHHEAKWE